MLLVSACCLPAAAFMRKLSDTILKMVAEDEKAVKNFHYDTRNKHAMGKEALDKKGAQYWANATRRSMPDPAALKSGLADLWHEFEGAEGLDPTTGEHLFTDLTWDVLKAIKQLIDHGRFCGKFRLPPPLSALFLFP